MPISLAGRVVLAGHGLATNPLTNELFALLNPINHALTPEDVDRYKVEPYVVAADVYSVAPHVGRGGWTWYTGSAAWMYRSGIEGILGIRREGAFLIVDPCIPMAWSGFEAMVRVDTTCFELHVDNSAHRGSGVESALLDGEPLQCCRACVRLPLDGRKHILALSLE